MKCLGALKSSCPANSSHRAIHQCPVPYSTSPVLHTVTVTGLVPRTQYYYTAGVPENGKCALPSHCTTTKRTFESIAKACRTRSFPRNANTFFDGGAQRHPILKLLSCWLAGWLAGWLATHVPIPAPHFTWHNTLKRVAFRQGSDVRFPTRKSAANGGKIPVGIGAVH